MVTARWRSPSRWVLGAVAGLLVVAIAWFGVARVTAPGRAVRVLSDAALARTAAGDGLRIVAWNIAHGRGLARNNFDGGDRDVRARRLERIAQRLARLDADVVVLNEVDFDSSWSHGVDQARVLADALGMPHRAKQRNWDAAVPFFRVAFGNAILSRFPLGDCALLDYPARSRWGELAGGKKRGLHCVVSAPSHRFRLVAVHLDHLDAPTRVESAAMIAKLHGADRLPLVLAGDFNTGPTGYPEVDAPAGGTALDRLVAAGLHVPPQVTPTPPHFTFRADAPRRVIDWVLVPRDWHIESWQALNTRDSDHRPVMAVVRPAGEVRDPH